MDDRDWSQVATWSADALDRAERALDRAFVTWLDKKIALFRERRRRATAFLPGDVVRLRPGRCHATWEGKEGVIVRREGEWALVSFPFVADPTTAALIEAAVEDLEVPTP